MLIPSSTAWTDVDPTMLDTKEMIDYKNIITLESGKRSGQPCIRGMRIMVGDILSYLASDMSIDEILADFPSLTKEDILAALAYSADAQKGRN